MDDFNSETDSDYTSYWRDWVSAACISLSILCDAGHGGLHKDQRGEDSERTEVLG
jgi:hypothetical protein